MVRHKGLDHRTGRNSVRQVGWVGWYERGDRCVIQIHSAAGQLVTLRRSDGRQQPFKVHGQLVPGRNRREIACDEVVGTAHRSRQCGGVGHQVRARVLDVQDERVRQ